MQEERIVVEEERDADGTGDRESRQEGKDSFHSIIIFDLVQEALLYYGLLDGIKKSTTRICRPWS